MYAQKVKEIESGKRKNAVCEKLLRKIATKYQSVKSLLLQTREKYEACNF